MFFNKKINLILAFVFVGIFLNAQSTSADKAALKEELQAIRKKANYIKTDVKDGIAMVNDFLKKDLTAHPELKAEAFIQKTNSFLRLGFADSVTVYLQKSEDLIVDNQLDSLYGIFYQAKGFFLIVQKKYLESIPVNVKAYEYGQKYNDTRLKKHLSRILGDSYITMGKPDTGKMYVDTLMSISKSLKDTAYMGVAHTLYGKYEYTMGNLVEGANHIFRAYELALETKNDRLVSVYAKQLAEMYHNLGNLPKALEYQKKINETRKKLNEHLDMEVDELAIASMLLNLGKTKECETHLQIIEKEYQTDWQQKYQYHLAAIEGGLFFEKEKWKEAEIELNKLLPIKDKVDIQLKDEVLFTGFSKLAKLHLQKKEYKKAIAIGEQQLKAKMIGFENKKELHGILAQSYQATNREKKAIQNLMRRDEIRDTIDLFYKGSLSFTREQEINKQLQQQEMAELKYKNQLSEMESNRHRNLLLFVIALAGLLLGLIYLWGRQRKLQLENSLVEVKQQLLKLQVNPHFIFNALNSIQNSVLTLNKEKSVELISKFSKLTRQVLQNSDKAMVPIHEEIQLLTNYMDLEKVRTKNKFDYEIEIGEGVDIYNEEVPSMMLQLFVENAIWHGIIPKEEKGLIQLKFEKQNKRIKVSVEDNGIGRKMSAQIKTQDQQQKKSMGIKLVKQRIQTLNKKYKTNIELLIKDKTNNEGTQTMLIA